jgi:hypothetical protein
MALSGAVTVGCDGKEALRSGFEEGEKYKANMAAADFDMVSSLRRRSKLVQWYFAPFM